MLAAPPPPQVSGAAQVPQDATARAAPQLSVPETMPQFLPRRVQKAESLSGIQLIGSPQTLAVPLPPQVWGAAQVPQDATLRDAAQLSAPETMPQFLPRRVQKALSLSGVHVAGLPNICSSDI